MRTPAAQAQQGRVGAYGEARMTKPFARAIHAFTTARDAHERLRYTEAKRWYTKAADEYGRVYQTAKADGSDELAAAANTGMARAVSALERLVGALSSPSPAPPTATTTATNRAAAASPVAAAAAEPVGTAAPSRDTGVTTTPSPSIATGGGPSSSGGGQCTSEELRVLRSTSTVNGRVFLPWVERDASESLAGSASTYVPIHLRYIMFSDIY